MPLPPFVIPRFNPREIPGLQAWYDAADSASVTLDAGRVSQWSDKSGNGRHATNTTSGSTQPSYTTAGRNGLNVLTFAAASVQRLTVPSSTAAFNFLHDGTACYYVAVSAYGTTADPNAIYGLFGNNQFATANAGLAHCYDDRTSLSASDGLRVDVTRAVGGSIVANPLNVANTSFLSGHNNLAAANSTVVQEVLLDLGNATAASRVKIRSNGGAEVAENNKTGSPSTANAALNFQLGCIGNNATPLQGDICELMFFSQLPTASARDLVRRYLGAKWGVTVA